MTDRKKKRSSDFWWWGDDEFFKRLMDDIYKDIIDFMKNMRFEIENTTPTFISFRIYQNGRKPPRIEIERGPRGIRPVEEEKPQRIEIKERREKPKAEKYEEAPYTYNVDVNQVRIDINVEGVESEENVDLDFREESVEIKVFCPKTGKSYYAILPLPTYVDPEMTQVEVRKDRVTIKIPRKQPAVEEGRWWR